MTLSQEVFVFVNNCRSKQVYAPKNHLFLPFPIAKYDYRISLTH